MKEMTDEHALIRLKGGANYRIALIKFEQYWMKKIEGEQNE